MSGQAANQHQADTLLRVFFMLIVMALLTIRAGVDARPTPVFLRLEGAPLPDDETIENHPSPADFHDEALMLLAAAEAVAQLLLLALMRAGTSPLPREIVLATVFVVERAGMAPRQPDRIALEGHDSS